MYPHSGFRDRLGLGLQERKRTRIVAWLSRRIISLRIVLVGAVHGGDGYVVREAARSDGCIVPSSSNIGLYLGKRF